MGVNAVGDITGFAITPKFFKKEPEGSTLVYWANIIEFFS
jgi:hypothetical protein